MALTVRLRSAAVAVALVGALGGLARAAGPALDLPPGPVQAVHAHPGADSFFDITLSGVGPGHDVADGVAYTGWCAEDNGRPNTSPVTLWNSDDPALPGNLAGFPWDRVNYLLNHKQGTWRDVQAALWLLTLGVSNALPVTPPAQAMLADAHANGAGFVPAPGQVVVAVLVTGDRGLGTEGFQDTLIELEAPPACDCAGAAFVAERYLKINNDAFVDGHALVKQAGGLLRTGRKVFATDGSRFTADLTTLGNAISAWSVRTNRLLLGRDAVVRDGSGDAPPPAGPFPLRAPSCAVPAFECGGQDVVVNGAVPPQPLAPGSYGRVVVPNDATLVLAPGGTFAFCELKIGRTARVVTSGRTTIAVAGSVQVGGASYLGPEPPSEPTPLLNVLGLRVALSQSAVVRARVTAPNARLSFQRDATLQGCFCTDVANTDKHITLACVP